MKNCIAAVAFVAWCVGFYVCVLTSRSWYSIDVTPFRPRTDLLFELDFNVTPWLFLPSAKIEREIYWYDATPIVFEDLKLLFCWIPKNACTQFKALACRYFGSDISDVYTPGGASAVHDGTCAKKHFVADRRESAILEDVTFTKLAVLRDPFERFLSGFMDKCVGARLVCHGCPPSNISCFVEQNYNYIRYSTLYSSRLSAVRVDSADHFFPQFWFCRFSRYRRNYTTVLMDQTERSRQNIRRHLSAAKFPPGIIDSGWGAVSRQPFFHASGRPSRNDDMMTTRHAYFLEFAANPRNIQLWLQTYLVDYLLLDIPVPKWLTRYCCLGRCGCFFSRCLNIDCYQ